MSYLVMPHRSGYAVMFSEIKTFPARNGRPEFSKEINNSCYFPTKEQAEAKAKELEEKGCKIRGITECIY